MSVDPNHKSFRGYTHGDGPTNMALVGVIVLKVSLRVCACFYEA